MYQKQIEMINKILAPSENFKEMVKDFWCSPFRLSPNETMIVYEGL